MTKSPHQVGGDFLSLKHSNFYQFGFASNASFDLISFGKVFDPFVSSVGAIDLR